jgi:hypothetical protein
MDKVQKCHNSEEIMALEMSAYATSELNYGVSALLYILALFTTDKYVFHIPLLRSSCDISSLKLFNHVSIKYFTGFTVRDVERILVLFVSV